MPVKYTNIPQSSAKGIKKYLPHLAKNWSTGQCVEVATRLAAEAGYAGQEDMIANIALTLKGRAQYAAGKCIHLFVDPELVEFLEHAMPDDVEPVDVYKTLKQLPLDFSGWTDEDFQLICVNFPLSSGFQHSILLGGTIGGMEPGLVVWPATPTTLVWSDGSNMLRPEWVDKRPMLKRTLTCVKALIFYMHAFPEVVIPHSEAPVLCKVQAAQRLYVPANETARAETQGARSPHYRRGHLRHLTSERFVHKRGQTVFVRGSFVKGKAFDVLSPERTE